MAEHVAYEIDKRIIYVTTAPVDGEVSINVEEHLYSDMKIDWQVDTTLGKFKFPIESVGGNPLPGSKFLGATFFLDNDWKIRPYEANHKFNLSGNLFAPDGTSVMIPTIGSYQVLSEMFVSNLTDSTVHQLEAMDLLTYGGKLYYDENSSNTGQNAPIGTAEYPVNNIEDGFALAGKYSLYQIYTYSNITLDRDVSGFVMTGITPKLIFNANGYKADSCKFNDIVITGDFNDSLIVAFNCGTQNVLNIHGALNNCYYFGKILIAAGQNLNTDNCQSGIPGLDSPEIDMHAGEDTTFSSRLYSGGMTITNCDTPACTATLSFADGGKPHLEPNNTDGLLSVRGSGALDDRSDGSVIETSAWLEATDVELMIEGDMIPTATEWKILQKTTKAILVQKDRIENADGFSELTEP